MSKKKNNVSNKNQNEETFDSNVDEILIQMVRSNPVIYDKSDEFYGFDNHKNNAFDNVSVSIFSIMQKYISGKSP